MSNFNTELNKLIKLRHKINDLEKSLGTQIENHLGDGWYITYDRGDGILLLSPDASNYRISTYTECQKLPRDDAVKYIEDRPFN